MSPVHARIRGQTFLAHPLLVAEVAPGARTRQVDPEQGLVVFGFDADKRDGGLQAITDELRGRHELRIYAVGRPSGRTAVAFRRPTDAIADPTPDAACPPAPYGVRPPAAEGIDVRG